MTTITTGDRAGIFMGRGMIQGGRRSGKSSAQRKQILAALADGREVHVAAHDGLWRVTATGIGPLWEKIRQPCPDRRPLRPQGLYRQLQQGVRS